MKTSKLFFIIIVLLVFYFKVVATDNVICSDESKSERILDIAYLRTQGKQLLYLVSYAIFFSPGDKLQNFVKSKAFENETYNKVLTIGMRKGHHFEYDYGPPFILFKLENGKIPSNFIENFSCADKSIPFYKTTQVKFKKIENYAPTLFYGCKVQIVNQKFSVEKVSVLVANNANGSSYTNQQLAFLASEKPKIINFNYDMIKTKGFCICDDIIDFVECEQPKNRVESNFTFYLITFIVFSLVLTFFALKIFNKISACLRRTNVVTPTNE